MEVESHFHSVSEHIEPQLSDLATGFYGPDAYGFLKRYRTFDRYSVDTFEPVLPLVIDALTPEVRDAAARTGFHALECSPFDRTRISGRSLSPASGRGGISLVAVAPDSTSNWRGGRAGCSYPADGGKGPASSQSGHDRRRHGLPLFCTPRPPRYRPVAHSR